MIFVLIGVGGILLAHQEGAPTELPRGVLAQTRAMRALWIVGGSFASWMAARLGGAGVGRAAEAHNIT